MDIAVVGCGFAGLAAAIAFRQCGHAVTVYERSGGIPDTSAAISLAPNALRCLQILGVRDEYPPSAAAHTLATVRTDTGRVLIRSSLARFAGGAEYCLAPRTRLLNSLLEQLPAECVRFSRRVTDVQPSGEVLIDGEQRRFDLVVAADGVHSVCRRNLWPDDAAPRRTGITAWTWMVDETLDDGYGAVWGRFAEFGILPLADGRTYVWGGARPGHAELTRYAGWPDPLPVLIGAVEPDRLSTVELTEVSPPRRLAHGRVVLVGDAAHAMRPLFGQGAALAMEDAIALARGGVAELARRRHRMVAMYWASRCGSAVTMPKYRALAAARNALLPLVPDRVFTSGVGMVSHRRRPPGTA
ncbi:2-polyprenyl-6-methoxyphenol hydroxylase [Mycolicibacterium rutilum]|uniref:2-polyprenyl-6-methoxyphenol hydroxylase n=1 Tax=Mycolicibacterium rutilum TaxID=370526 RepID=A0A1H6KS65_MYCRU|nr:NAD(P)/FAD-dependent oxidoreductase [Mycolicibacterium rutilum]SEH76399.1 2-polyprenyl-6-methoxyphenol hydroxylase [Mycolicibacterium rutilum]